MDGIFAIVLGSLIFGFGAIVFLWWCYVQVRAAWSALTGRWEPASSRTAPLDQDPGGDASL